MIRFLLCSLLVIPTSAYVNVYQQFPGGPFDEFEYPLEDPERFADPAPEFSEQQLDQLERELASAKGQQPIVYEEELRIPGEIPKTNDSYLCTAFKQHHLRQKSIVSFEAISSESAHHVILFVCELPGINEPVEAWDCGEMSDTQAGRPSQYIKGPPCASNSAPIYAWSHGSGHEKTALPDGVGFPIGGLSKNQYIVLQVHYMDALTKEDYAGVKITFTDGPTPKTAATLLMVTGGRVDKKIKENLEAACVIDEDVEMHPIAFRVHTHRHGEKVSGWLVKENEADEDKWTLIGERSPQKPQIFEKVKNQNMVIRQGDVLASRCVINNNENHPIEVGPTSEDEMCNFYLMYYTNGKPLSNNVCSSPGAPYYHLGRDAGLNHIPE